MLVRALAQTAPLWPPIRLSYSWVHRAAHILNNEEGLCVEELRRDYRQLLAGMLREKEQAGELQSAVLLFLKVTRSYWKGLFHCYMFPREPCRAPTTTWSTASDRYATVNGVPVAEEEPPLHWW
jgi:hypothetical protein